MGHPTTQQGCSCRPPSAQMPRGELAPFLASPPHAPNITYTRHCVPADLPELPTHHGAQHPSHCNSAPQGSGLPFLRTAPQNFTPYVRASALSSLTSGDPLASLLPEGPSTPGPLCRAGQESWQKRPNVHCPPLPLGSAQQRTWSRILALRDMDTPPQPHALP